MSQLNGIITYHKRILQVAGPYMEPTSKVLEELTVKYLEELLEIKGKEEDSQ